MTDAPPSESTSRDKLAYYPQYCFHLSPTLNKWCPLRAADVVGLTRFADFEGQNVFFYLNHPIKWVRVAGVVVGSAVYFGKKVYTVDDGSGAAIECVLSAQSADKTATKPGTDSTATAGAATTVTTETAPKPPTSDSPLPPGTVVDIKGELRPFRDALQIHVKKLTVLRATEQEVQIWTKVTAFARDTLRRPWLLDRQTVRACRRAAAGKKEEEKEGEKGTEDGQSKDNVTNEDANREKSGKQKEGKIGDKSYATKGREDHKGDDKKRKRNESPDNNPLARADPPPPPKKWVLAARSDVAEETQAEMSSTVMQRPEPPPPPKKWDLGAR